MKTTIQYRLQAAALGFDRAEGYGVKTMTLSQFLTDAQIVQAVKLYEAHGMDAVAKIQVQVIEPHMATINDKLGQKNDARYLAYAVVYTLSQCDEERWS